MIYVASTAVPWHVLVAEWSTKLSARGPFGAYLPWLYQVVKVPSRIFVLDVVADYRACCALRNRSILTEIFSDVPHKFAITNFCRFYYLWPVLIFCIPYLVISSVNLVVGISLRVAEYDNLDTFEALQICAYGNKLFVLRSKIVILWEAC
jgi:hypothetical protein